MPPAMYHFESLIQARPAEATDGEAIELRGVKQQTLSVPPAALEKQFAVSFEHVTDSLAELSQMFIEPDGSFVWTSPAAVDEPWQLDGVLYDRGDRLQYVELKGSCPADSLDQLLAALGWP